MDYLWILIAFACGFLVKQLGLPPLVGYLIAGFGLNALGFSADDNLQLLADVGITLMLFTIGLKLNLRSLIKPEICVTAISHCFLWCLLVLGKWFALAALSAGMVNFLDMSWETALLIAFALSFSSTVGVIKLLEDQDELKTRHGKVAIGVLVIQDIIAVLFMAIATGKAPSLWALSLFLLIPLRPALNMLMVRGGHGELLPLAGFFLALGGSELFTLVNMKGDLGALVIGILVAGYPKSTELYKSLIGFKDIFLIGFFLSIGFTAIPTLEMLVTASFISLLLVGKFILFISLFLLLKMRPRNAFLCAMTLSNFSEFGLIVANMAADQQWLSKDWLVIIALAVTLSFIISGSIFKHSHKLYARYKDFFHRLRFGEDVEPFKLHQPDSAKILVIGIGRVGSATYDSLEQSNPGQVLAVDADEERVEKYQLTGKKIILGDGEDADFWSKVNLDNINLIMLSTPNVSEMTTIIEQIKNYKFSGRIACIARFEDERQELLDAGADAVFSYFSEVGTGFAEEGKKLLHAG